MWSSLAALIWVAGLLTIWVRIEPLAVRLLHFLEQGRPTPKPLNEPEPMPVHLRAYITQQSEAWAREETLQRANELYAQYRDWTKVMMAMTVGE